MHQRNGKLGAKSQRGLSLVECCAALAIASVLVGSGVSSFADQAERRRLEGRAAELATDLHFLRTEAVQRNQGLRAGFQSDSGGTCYILHTGENGDCTCNSSGVAQCGDPQAEVIKAVTLHSADRVALESNVSSILIDPRLGTATPGGTLRLTDSRGRELRQVVNIMGRVRTCSPAGSVAGYPLCT